MDDEELKARFDRQEARFDRQEARFDRLDARFQRLEELIIGVKESLEREIRDIAGRMDNQARRMRHHEALWKAGRTWSIDLDDWRTDMDRAFESRDQQIADLSARLRRLEKPE